MDKYKAAERKMDRILDALGADGYHEAASIRHECRRNDIECYPSLAGIVSQIDKFLRAIPQMYVPRTHVHGSTTDADGGLYIELNWANYTLRDIATIPCARFEITFLSEGRVRYNGMIGDHGNITHDVKLSEGRLLKQAISEAKTFFKKWPESPKVDVQMDESTPVGRILAEHGAVITNLESLERAVSDVCFATECMGHGDIRLPRTNVPEIDEFAANFRKEYASLVGRVAAKYKRSVLAELFPLARTVYRMCLDHGRDARVHSQVFRECAKAADADVCWKCGSLESVFWSKHEKYRKMCTGCSDALVYAAV